MIKTKLNWILSSTMLLALSTIMISCGGGANPEIIGSNSYSEKDDVANNETMEASGLTINGTDWLEVAGTFSSNDDKDLIEVSIDPAIFPDDTTKYKVQLEIIVSGEPVGMLYKPLFPANAVVYNDDESRPPQNLGKIGMTPIILQKGDSKIKFIVTGSKPGSDGKSLYSDNKPYSLKMK